jgi:hypothetical protein
MSEDSMLGHDAIERSQKKIYLAIKSELALFEKRKTRELRSYERSFRSSFPKSARPAKKSDLIQAITRSNLVLVGDFHPFRQSQKGFLRLLEECAAKVSRPVLALECIQQHHQNAVNEYLANYLTAEELRDKIDFEKHWPFSWNNYRELLTCAKQLKIPVLALNISGRKKKAASLRDRDIAASNKISDEILSHKNSTVFILYGELHLAQPHLPRELRISLKRQARLLTVHQNIPELYWKTKKLKNGQRPEVLRLSSDQYCVLNSVPWVKLRSYLEWLEGNADAEAWEEALDVAGLVHHYAELLRDTIGLTARTLHDVEILPPDQLSPGIKFADQSEKALFRHALEFQRTAYLPKSGKLLIPVISTNSMSEAASYLLWHSQREPGTAPIEPGSHPWIAHFFIGYFGSKVLNPKRKCNETSDIKKLLFQMKKQRRQNQPKAKVLARALALLHPYLKKEKLSARSQSLRGSKEMEACRLAGYILAERFFLSLLNEPALLSFVQIWYQNASPGKSQALLKKTAAKISRLPFKTFGKTDRF